MTTRSVSIVDMEGATIDSVQIPDDYMAILYVGRESRVIAEPTPQAHGRRIADAVIASMRRPLPRGRGTSY